jgi:hypothetical protein
MAGLEPFSANKLWNHVIKAQTHFRKGLLTIRCRLEAVSSQGMRVRYLTTGDGTITFWWSGGKKGIEKREVNSSALICSGRELESRPFRQKRFPRTPGTGGCRARDLNEEAECHRFPARSAVNDQEKPLLDSINATEKRTVECHKGNGERRLGQYWKVNFRSI